MPLQPPLNCLLPILISIVSDDGALNDGGLTMPWPINPAMALSDDLV